MIFRPILLSFVLTDRRGARSDTLSWKHSKKPWLCLIPDSFLALGTMQQRKRALYVPLLLITRTKLTLVPACRFSSLVLKRDENRPTTQSGTTKRTKLFVVPYENWYGCLTTRNLSHVKTKDDTVLVIMHKTETAKPKTYLSHHTRSITFQ